MKGEVKETIGQFFESLTVRNMQWRQDVAKQMALQTASDPKEFRFWSELGMHYFHGTPVKAQPETSERLSVVFIGRNGRPGEYDPMAAQEREFLEAQKQRELLEKNAQAEEAELVVKGDVTKGDSVAPEDVLQVVDPDEIRGGGRR